MEDQVRCSSESHRSAGPSPSKIIVNPADRSQFIATSYPAIKEARPDLKVLIREASGIEPRAFARFGESCLEMSNVNVRDTVEASSRRRTIRRDGRGLRGRLWRLGGGRWSDSGHVGARV